MNRIRTASVSLLIAGVLHFATAPERFAHASVFMGVFYLFLGCFQLGLVIGYERSKDPRWLRIIFFSCLGLLVLFVLNQVAAGRLSFVVAEPYGPFMVVRKLVELLVVLLLFGTVRTKKPLH